MIFWVAEKQKIVLKLPTTGKMATMLSVLSALSAKIEKKKEVCRVPWFLGGTIVGLALSAILDRYVEYN